MTRLGHLGNLIVKDRYLYNIILHNTSIILLSFYHKPNIVLSTMNEINSNYVTH